MTEILIFKTNVTCQKQVEQLQALLHENWAISKWNFDLEDCDKILRIEASAEISEEIIKLLHSKGFDCQELPC